MRLRINKKFWSVVATCAAIAAAFIIAITASHNGGVGDTADVDGLFQNGVTDTTEAVNATGAVAGIAAGAEGDTTKAEEKQTTTSAQKEEKTTEKATTQAPVTQPATQKATQPAATQKATEAKNTDSNADTFRGKEGAGDVDNIDNTPINSDEKVEKIIEDNNKKNNKKETVKEKFGGDEGRPEGMVEGL